MSKTIRRVIAILLAATAIILLVLPASDVNATYTKGDYVIDGGTLVSYTGNESDITIPIGISDIGKDAFSNNNTLKKVYIPDEVTSIDYAAFENCKNLEKVSIGDGVKSIGASAFSGCQSLTDINIPKATETIGSGAFAACPNLSTINVSDKNRNFICLDGVLYSRDGKKLYQYLAGRPYSTYEIPEPVSEIGEFGFYGANMLTKAQIARGVEEIPDYAFLNCTALNQVTIPSTVKAIRRGAFGGCPNLTKLNVPTSVGYIDDKAFTSLDGVTGDVVNENTGEVLSESNQEATPINTTDNQTADASQSEVDNQTTDESEPTDNVSIAGTIESVNPSAKAEADSSEIGSTKIVGGQAVFLINPKSMNVRGFDINAAQTEDSIADSGNSSSEGEDIRAYSGREFDIIDNVFGHYGGNNTDISVPDGVTKLGNRVFYNNKNINSVSLPNSLSEIGDFAFARSSINEITIPDGVEKIGYAAFYGCTNLSTINVPTSVKEIELGALDGTQFLNNWNSIEDGNNFLILGDGILAGYKGHTSDVKVPNGVKTIAPGVFEGDTRLSSIELPESLQVIGEDAFNGCKKLSSVELPKNLKFIEDRAFKDTALTNVIIPQSVEGIGLGAFDTTHVNGGMEAAIFKGATLPDTTYKPTATRLSANDLRTNAFNGTKYAFVTAGTDMNSGSIFDAHTNGFRGLVFSNASNSEDETIRTLQLRKCVKEPEIDGSVKIESELGIGKDTYYLSGVSNTAFDEYKNQDWCNNKLTGITMDGDKSNELESMLSSINFSTSTGSNLPAGKDGAIKINTDSSMNAGMVKAYLPDGEESFNLNIKNDSSLKQSFDKAFDNRYGTFSNVDMENYSIDMTDRLGSVPIKKMATSKLNISMPVPSKYADIENENIKVATLDDNGLLEEISSEISESENGAKSISFVASHLSPFAVYVSDGSLVKKVGADGEEAIDSGDSQASYGDFSVIEESLSINSEESMSPNNLATENIVFGTLQKEVAPGIPVRYFIAVIMLAMSAILLIYKPKRIKK